MAICQPPEPGVHEEQCSTRTWRLGSVYAASTEPASVSASTLAPQPPIW